MDPEGAGGSSSTVGPTAGEDAGNDSVSGTSSPNPNAKDAKDTAAQPGEGNGPGSASSANPVGLSKTRTKSSAKPSVRRFRDFNEFGFYEGALNSDGKRHGSGKMTYDSGNYYTGSFVDDKFEGLGLYKWKDDDEQEGSWKSGERHGVSVFRAADGTVEMSSYESGKAVGEGVTWPADRKTAYKLVNGDKKNEISLGMAEKMAKEMFGLPVPEPVEVQAKAHAPLKPTTVAPSKAGFLARLFSSRIVSPDGKLMFKDYGDWGVYEGEVDGQGRRQGKGKMTYESGNYFDGAFVDDKFYCDKGVYSWHDGDLYDGPWKDGERSGIGIFKSADGSVEYAVYDEGNTVGDGLLFSADRETVHLQKDGKKRMEVTQEEAESMAREKFQLPIPEPAETAASKAAYDMDPPQKADTQSSSDVRTKIQPSGFLGKFFAKDGEAFQGPDGKVMYKDNGEWGIYEGTFDSSGAKRQGKGVMKYDSGNVYTGGFVDNKYHSDSGTYRWADGDVYEGPWAEGERSGTGVFKMANGDVEVTKFDKGQSVGDGIAWNADRSISHKLVDGDKKNEISLGMAEKMARELFDMAVPPPHVIDKAVPTAEKPSILARLFGSNDGAGFLGEDGKWKFKDNGDWGVYEGEFDASGSKREGKGVMKYDSGNMYDGSFKNNTYDGDTGLYRWADGDEYEGPWKDGERTGNGIFRMAGGDVEYCKYDKGQSVGDGIVWNADRSISHKLVDGVKNNEISLGMAEKLAREKFDLPVPPLFTAKRSPKPSILGRFFSGSSAAPPGGGPTGPRFVDQGDSGVYEGGLVDGKRQGFGKMTYDSGNSYEGDFYQDKYHGGLGSYKWADGSSFEGSWQNGLFDGIGIFRTNEGVDYSFYKSGYATGVGVGWGSNYTKAHHLLDGFRVDETTLDHAKQLAEKKFGLPVPSSAAVQPAVASGLIRFFRPSAVGSDGKLRFKDNGDWGSYDGTVDANGKRQGKGTMTYDSGNIYDGSFLDDVYSGETGVYKWDDGDAYDGAWKNGERHGLGIFTSADGTVNYSMYSNGSNVGHSITWSPDRKSVFKVLGENKKIEISLSMGEKLSQEKFNLPVPAPMQEKSTATKNTGSLGGGILSRLFSSKRRGPDGRLMFKDYGDWGTYEGDLDSNDQRQGKGRMEYESRNYYDGPFDNNMFDGENGVYHWADGDEYRGSWKKGERNGSGTFVSAADGTVEYSMYDAGSAVGDGLSFTTDGKSAFKLVNGEKTIELTPEEAEALSQRLFNLKPPSTLPDGSLSILSIKM